MIVQAAASVTLQVRNSRRLAVEVEVRPPYVLNIGNERPIAGGPALFESQFMHFASAGPTDVAGGNYAVVVGGPQNFSLLRHDLSPCKH